ncbi:MAG: hypothetical protein HQ553_16135 [Chloroflexi bacterium]|nr:hypothetical protein [Chloroflexota bacterium]
MSEPSLQVDRVTENDADIASPNDNNEGAELRFDDAFAFARAKGLGFRIQRNMLEVMPRAQGWTKNQHRNTKKGVLVSAFNERLGE